jgi:hypothetical protein
MAAVIDIAKYFKFDGAKKEARELVAQLDALITRLDAIVDNSQKTNKALQTQATTQSQTNKAIKDTNESIKNLSGVEKERIKIQSETQKVMSKLLVSDEKRNVVLQKGKVALQEKNKEQRLDAQITRAAEGSYKQLEAQLRKNIERLKSMSKEQRENSREGKQLAATIDRQDKELKQLDTTMGKSNRNVGNYKSAFAGVSKVLGAFGLALGAGALAVKGFNKTIAATQSLGDKFEIMMGGMRAGVDKFFKVLATGDFSNFLSNMREAIKAGKEYAKVMDDLGDRQRAQQIAEADVVLERQKLLATLRDQMSTNEERIAAADRIIAMEDELGSKRTENARIAYQAEIDRLKALTGLGKEELETFLRNYSNNSDLIAQAEKYNALIKERKGIERAQMSAQMGGGGAMGAGMMIPRMESGRVKEIEQEIKGFNEEQLAFITTYNKYLQTNDEGLDKLVTSYSELKNAEASALEATQRVLSRRSTLLDENARKQDQQNEDTKKSSKKNNELTTFDTDLQIIEYARRQKEYAEMLAAQQMDHENYIDETLANAEDFIDAQIAEDNREFENWIENEKAKTDKLKEEEEKRAEAREQGRDVAIDIARQTFELIMTLQDRQLANLETQKAHELELAGDNAMRREQIEKEYAQRSTEIKRKQANTEKALGIFNAAINTAVGITKALSLGPVGVALAILIGILGGVQIATIAAKPIPQFAKGTKGLKEGTLAEFGEAGQEIVKEPGKPAYIAKKRTIDYLPKGTEIIPNYETEKILAGHGGISEAKLDQLINEERMTRAAISGQIHHSTVVTERGFEYQTRRGLNKTKWLNKYMHRGV